MTVKTELDLRAAREISVFGEEQWRVGIRNSHIAVSPDGTTIVATTERAPFLLDGTTGKPLRRFDPTGHRFDGPLAWTGDGQYVVAVAGSDRLVVFGAQSGALHCVLSTDKINAPVLVAPTTQSSEFLLCGGHENAQLWSASEGTLVREFPYWERPECALASVVSAEFSRDGRKLVLLTSRGASVWDASSGAPLFDVSDTLRGVSAAAFSSDGEQLYVGTFYGELAVLRVADGAVLRRARMGGRKRGIRQIFASNFSAQLQVLCVGSRRLLVATDSLAMVQEFEDRALTKHVVLDRAQQRLLCSTVHGELLQQPLGAPEALKASAPRGTALALRWGLKGEEWIVARSGGLVERFSSKDNVLKTKQFSYADNVSLSPQGAYLYFVDADKPDEATICDVHGEVALSLEQVADMRAAVNDLAQYCLLGNSCVITDWDQERRVPVNAGHWSEIHFSLDGERVLVQSDDRLTVLNALTEETIASAAGGPVRPITSSWFNTIYRAGLETIDIFLANSLTKQSFQHAIDRPESIAVTRDGGVVAVGTTAGLVHLFDTTTNDGALRTVVFEASRGAVTALAFAPMEPILAVAGEDALTRLWDVSAFIKTR